MIMIELTIRPQTPDVMIRQIALISKTTVTRKPLAIAKKATLVFLFFEKAAYISAGKI